MKKTWSFLLILCLLPAVLFGCAAQEPDPPPAPAFSETDPFLSLLPTETAPATEPAVPGIPEKPWAVSDWIGILHREEYNWTDSAGNHNRMNLDIPYLIPACDMASEFNMQMRYLNQQLCAEVEEAMAGATSPITLSLSFEASIFEDTLSLLLIRQLDADYTEYTAYNFDLEELEAEPITELCEEYLDLNYPQFLLATNELILARTQALYGETMANDPTYLAILDRISTDPGPMAQRQLYLDSQGQLMLVYPAPSLAGAEYYPTAEPFDVRLVGWTSVPAEEEAYAQFFDIVLSGAAPDESAAMLVTAFEEDPEDFGEALALRGEAEICMAAEILSQAYLGRRELLETLASEWESLALRDALAAELGE